MIDRQNAHWQNGHTQGGHSIEVYRGYFIQPAAGGEVFYVQREGVTIAACASRALAHDAIDQVA